MLFYNPLSVLVEMADVRNFYGGAAGFRLFFSERDSDVAIRVEWEGQRWHFPGHKLVLCAMSEVFRMMLETDMLERNSRTITIRDANPHAVKQFLKYLYMGIVDFNGWYEAMNLLKVAHKYSVQTLINLTETYLVTQVLFSNVCVLHEMARTYTLKALKKHTQVFILDAGFIISATDGFFNMKSKSLENFLGSTLFNVENEGSILSSLREWAVCECSRRCVPLSRANVLSAMEPFLKYIDWSMVPEENRTFVPRQLVERYKDDNLSLRKRFHVPASLQYHMSYVKFAVELGAFQEPRGYPDGNLCCLKFSVDNHVFLCGFRIVGLFRIFLSGPSCLALSREDNKVFVQFNLHSLRWTRGVSVGKDVWRELVAYLPFPIRVDPFSTYMFHIRSGSVVKDVATGKWPKTGLDSEVISSDLGTFSFRVYGPCYGITQLFVLPAPLYRNVCSIWND